MLSRWLRLAAYACAWSSLSLPAFAQQAPQAAPLAEDVDLSAELPRIPALTPEQEQQTFELQPGFRIELVAAEPLVADPVAFAFGGAGELFVIEMRDYSEQDTEHLGLVAKLVDTDGDGRMDQRTTFAENLSWPTAIWPWRDGVLVAEPPRIVWLRDTTGDGVADEREVWFEGFGRSNVQGLLNSFRWSVDGYIHGATSSSGGDIAQLSAQEAGDGKLALRGRDFAIDPLTKSVSSTSGGGQHGMCFNAWGDKFCTSNSDHLQQIIDLDQWLTKHPAPVPMPALRRSIAVDGPQAEVYRSSPVEPWRIVRTRLRVSGAVPGIVEGGGRAAGYFTGATATWIMDAGTGFGDAEHETALVCDVGSNLVHRKRLTAPGLFWSGERIDKESELVRSSDIWFRPVQLGDGPDGALYIADMYREVIEHPASLPPVIKRHLDLTSGNDRGRIWRVVPEAAATQSRLTAPATLDNAGLVQRLASPIAWQRRMASQLLVERDASDVRPQLEQLATSAEQPAGAILALHLLQRTGGLTASVLEAAVASQHPRVAQHAIDLVGAHPAEAVVQAQCAPAIVAAAAQTKHPHLQLAIARAAMNLPTHAKLIALRHLMRSTKEPLTRAVMIVSAGADSPLLFLPDPAYPAPAASVSASEQAEWLALLLPAWIGLLKSEQGAADSQFSKNVAKVLQASLVTDKATRETWLDALCRLPSGAAAHVLLERLDGDQRSQLTAAILKQLELPAGTPSKAEQLARAARGVRWLRLLPAEPLLETAEELLSPGTPEPMQAALAESLLWAAPEQGVTLLLANLRGMTPALKQKVLVSLLGYNQSLVRVADALQQKEIAPSEIAPEIRQQLFALPDAKLQQRFKDLLDTASSDRQAVIQRYRPAVAGTGNLSDGKATFQRVCAQCHRISDVGSDVGPPLKQLGDKSPEQLLDAILDPNREVDPKFLGYSVLLEDGRVLTGIIREESANQIVLAEAGGKLHTLARGDITKLQSTGLSLMPVGLEEQISPEQLRDLVTFLKKSGN
jgi:putative membrane-bound dehydrogenase-like protein